MKQLDLFNDVIVEPTQEAGRKACEIVAFPTIRNRQLVISTACKLLGLSKSAGRTFWTKHVREIRKGRQAQGISADQITADLDAYGRAVSREIDIRLTYRMGPDHAA